ncbi:alpha/beta fold hydrolase [Amycolatopsis albispora]|uniref:Alpha/beta hydrolase n=1 Tax=Amycolatopsis albispora TaxID=1804986 RepID=A0A344LA32_9PSEU|nr:alpha/beta fold hydrolase [Amycolatopsis albispora]AXB44906.1 alpha/beta hydrolase [Amycolatopsis albispora]
MAEHFAHLVRGSGPGLLLAHGGGGGIEGNYGMIVDDLARTHTVVGPDYPGSGATPRSETPLDLTAVADEVVRVAVDAGVERFAVLGYSLGTAVAVRAATRHPDRVTGLILTSGFSHPDNRLRLAADVWQALLAQGDRRLLAKYLLLMGSGERAVNALSEAELEAALDGLADFIPAGSPEHVDLVASVDTRDELARISVPTLVIATLADGLVPPSLSAALAAGIPGARYTEIDAGHNIGAEAREEWLNSIQQFLSEIG